MPPKKEPVYDIAIIGLGPGGLAAALEAAKKGLSVVAFSNRNQYARQQRVAITASTRAFLNGYRTSGDNEDNTFFSKMDNEPYGMEASLAQIKDVESFMLRKLEKFAQKNSKRVIIVDLEKSESKEGFEFKSEKENCSINTSGGTFQFKHLLAADGAKHSTATQVQHDLGKEITYVTHPDQPRWRYQASVQLQLKNGATLPLDFQPDKNTIDAKMRALQALGWTELFTPKSLTFKNEKGNKFSFAGEIPSSIFEMPNSDEKKRKLKDWAAIHIATAYGISPDDLEFKPTSKKPDKILLQAGAFELNLVKSQTPLVNLNGNKSVFGQTGDARRSPNFYHGHGLNDAIDIGTMFARCIEKSTKLFDTQKYTTHQVSAFVTALSAVSDTAPRGARCVCPGPQKFTLVPLR